MSRNGGLVYDEASMTYTNSGKCFVVLGIPCQTRASVTNDRFNDLQGPSISPAARAAQKGRSSEC